MTGQQLTMEINRAVVVEKPERFYLELLGASARIVGVIHSCIL